MDSQISAWSSNVHVVRFSYHRHLICQCAHGALTGILECKFYSYRTTFLREMLDMRLKEEQPVTLLMSIRGVEWSTRTHIVLQASSCQQYT